MPSSVLLLVVLTISKFGFGLGASKLKLCSEKSERPQICKMDESYVNNDPPEPHPATVYPVLDIYDITEIDEADQTVTIFADILISWEDPGISFTATNVTE